MIKAIKNDELIRGSFILFIMFNIFNFLNYLYQFLMARFLGPGDYGVLAVLFSFVYIFSIPSESIQNIITSYVGRFNLKKENGKIKYLFLKSVKRALLFSLFAFILFIPIAYFMSKFIKIDFFLLVLTGLLIFLFTLLPVIRGVLQGQKLFNYFGITMVTEGFLKLSLAIILIFIGLRVYGAIFAVILACAITLILGFFSIRKILKEKEERIDFKGIYQYSIPYFFAIISITLIYSLDVIFAKRFFNEEIAGVYAVASMLGKMIFFGTFAVGKAMFPLISEKHENGEKTGFLLKKSLKIIGMISIIVLLAYLFLPKLIISILFGEKYLMASNFIFIIGLALTFLSFANLIVLYGLSTNKIKKNSFYFLIFVFLEIALFLLFHSNLLEFSISLLVVNFLFFVTSLVLLSNVFKPIINMEPKK